MEMESLLIVVGDLEVERRKLLFKIKELEEIIANLRNEKIKES